MKSFSMKNFGSSTLSIIAAGVLGLVVLGALPAGAAPDSGADFPPCELSALLVKQTAQHEAQADFWPKLAKCLHDPDSNFWKCLAEAKDELLEDLKLAEEQYQTRLDACEMLGHGIYDPEIEPSEFSPIVDNKYLPLIPGQTLVYEKMTPEGLEHIEVTTLNETREIDGFLCRVVKDFVTFDGEVIEDTIDWIAQRVSGLPACDTGDVWYFGEIAQNFEDGFLDNLDGTWRTGKDDAKPGIIMPATPEVGDVYRQEFLLNEAEDMAQVISLKKTVHVKYGTFHNCLQTMEWSLLEPGTIEYKYYAPGLGLVLEVNPDTNERLELVQVIN
jgi:hypothetical protein